jgi:phosphopantetheinyl transferase
MPLVYQQDINSECRLGVWKITEPASFFYESVDAYNVISHPHKQIQHLAGRHLLKVLDSEFPLHQILKAEGEAPILEDGSRFFSVSHTGDYAAALISKKSRVGIDIESFKEKALKLSHRFLSEEERDILEMLMGDVVIASTAGWCVKEAVFKWYGKGGVDFIRDIKIISGIKKDDVAEIECKLIKENFFLLQVHLIEVESMLLTWV